MGLHNMDIEGGLRRIADRRIEEAMAEGKFDNLPGMGKPLDLEPMPADENARLMWWALRIMRQIERLTDESALPPLVTRVNELVRKVNTLGTNALKASVVLLDLDGERQRLRARLGKGG
jgi:hypothetical protein